MIFTVALILITLNVLISYQGFQNSRFFEENKFETDGILVGKQYKRLVMSGFLHGDWSHLIFNMISLYSFSGMLELHLGVLGYLAIYFGSLLGGNLFALYIHRNHGDYSAIGASGAVCGVIFASIALFPHTSVGIIGLPFHIPSWLYALGFVLYSIYGIKAQNDNIGHEAHLGGGVLGMLVALAFEPTALFINYLPILIVFVPTALFLYIIITNPHFLTFGIFNGRMYEEHYSPYDNVDDRYNAKKRATENELDDLLEKIGRKGYDKLTTLEKERLHDLTK